MRERQCLTGICGSTDPQHRSSSKTAGDWQRPILIVYRPAQTVLPESEESGHSHRQGGLGSQETSTVRMGRQKGFCLLCDREYG
jgi:hypothetical protein